MVRPSSEIEKDITEGLPPVLKIVALGIKILLFSCPTLN